MKIKMKINLRSTARQCLSILWIWMTVGCTEPPRQTEYTHVIPASATEVAALFADRLATKSGWEESGSAPAIRLIDEWMTGGKQGTAVIEALFRNPSQTGIDWNAPVYLFRIPGQRNALLTLKITELQKFRQSIQQLAESGLCTAPQKSGEYQYCEIASTGIGLLYDAGTLLVANGDNATQLRKIRPMLDGLMKQPTEQSIRSNPHFKAMMEQTGDIRLMGTPDALPFELRGILNWPHGTQLQGYVLFENGRIYVQLQQAGFQGQTNEGNQPFHPQNSNELQQAMTAIMRGIPFHIELTSQELMTLTNLRVLMEYAPNDPEVNTLYRLVNQVDKLSMRGDYHRTTFTVVLKQQRPNALKQLTDFFIQRP